MSCRFMSRQEFPHGQSQGAMYVRLLTVKRVPESFDCDLYNHERQCQHHTSEGLCLVLRHTKTKYGGMDLKIPDGWKQMLT